MEPSPPTHASSAAGSSGPGACSACGAPLADGFAFCENCGAPTGGAAPVGDRAPDTTNVPTDEVDSTRTTLLSHPGEGGGADSGATPAGEDDDTLHEHPAAARCSCGGTFQDGWCDTCGAPEPHERDHVVVTLSPLLGSVSDRGIVHHQNEDAGIVVDLGAAGAVACVVSDGVSNVEGSQEASAAAVEATAGVLTVAAADTGTASSGPDRASDGDGWLPALREARRAAAIAAAACTRPGARDAASCTWAAAVTDGTTVWAANVGDSRIYLVGDDGRGRQLGTDHSWAAEAVAQGADPATVMTDRRAHMITAWMGADAPELPDTTAEAVVEGPGWLLAVSDGLWNYCEDGDDLAALVLRLGGPSLDATALAEALVGFACAAGGADNVTISAARILGDPSAADPSAADPSAADPSAADPEPGA